MSLRVWVPFTDGTARDLGLAGLKFTFADSTKTSSNNSGKIGKCFYNNTLAVGGLLSTTNITLPVTQSWFCWAKFDLFYSSSSLTGVISQHDPTNKKNMGITVKYVSATTGYLSCSTGTGSSRTYNTYTGSTLLNTGIWYHLGFTYDGSTIKFYVNGVLDGTTSYSGQSQSAAPIRLFGWNIANSSYSMKGYLNDVRIYDHCLTPLEIKDLSKGLVLHYPLDDGNVTNTAYDCSGYCNNGTVSGTLTTNTDTPRYDKCTKYMDSASSIGIGNLSTLVPSGVFTFNIWFKRITGEWSSKGWETIIGGPSGFELLTKRSSTNSPVIVMYSWNNNAENDIPYELDKWNMLTMVRTSAGTIFYLNGDQKKTGGAGYIPSGNYFIGSWSAATNQNFRGMLSDARIYSTALSEDDIKELYNTAAFVDNKGDVGCYLFYEDGANSKELLPIPTSGVTFNSDGSYLVNGHTWSPTDYIPINPSGKTYYYDIEYSNLNSGNHLYIGFEKYDANKASGSNSECLYLVSTTSVSNHIRVTGTIGLATANGTAAAFTKLRILNNWDGASGTNQAIIHHISLKEVSTLTLNQINKQGLIKSDAFIEGDSATISKHGNVTANQLIEI